MFLLSFLFCMVYALEELMGWGMVWIIIDWEGATPVAFLQPRKRPSFFGGGGALSQRRSAKLLLVASQCPCCCKNLRTVRRIFKVRAAEEFTEICRLMQFGLYRDAKGAGMSYTVWWLGFGLDGPGFGSRQRQEIYLFSKTSRQALWPTRPRTQWVTVALSCGWKRAERETDHSRSSI